MKEWKNTLVAQVVFVQMLISRPQVWGLEFNSNILLRIYFFLKIYVTSSEGTISHNVLCYQQLSIFRYQVSFYAHDYFE